jgi:GTP-binding protein
MQAGNARFLMSAPSVSGCPDLSIPEFAFIGRSNVGKSSLINMLTGQKGLAKTSSLPGKTRLINFFEIAERWALVDLPGYGYAKLPKSEREKLQKMIHAYLGKRENLTCTFLLIDGRHELQKIDREFMEWLAENEKPFILLFTKVDKLSKTALQASLSKFKGQLLETWEELPMLILTSATTRQGRDEVLEVIGSMVR